jgi:prepilin-type N-terminal cleavage/methylation domain-containing protein/prepilin-type processing-associated H-X9-DG protein
MNRARHHLKFQSPNHAFSIIELLIVVGILAIVTAMLLTALSRSKRKVHNITCVTQLKQLGIITRLYADDHESKLPVAESLPSNPVNPQIPWPRISDVLGPYASKVPTTNFSASVFKCPSDKDFFFEAEGSSYQWNEWLNGQRIDLGESSTGHGIAVSNGVVLWQTNFTVLHVADTTPLLVDYDDFHPRAPKSGRNVVYMDGHATMFAPALLP